MSKSLIFKMERYRRLVESDLSKRRKIRQSARKLYLSKDQSGSYAEYRKLFKMRRNGSITRYVRVCQVTGRARGVYRQFGLGRQELKRAVERGLLFGVKWISW